MGKIKKLKDVELVGGTEQSDVYPITSTKAIYDESNKRLDNIIAELQKSADSSLETENKTIVGSINELKRLQDTGYLFKDVATPTTDPGTPKAKVFYIANGKGTYTNFGGLEVTEDDVVVLYWDSSWHKVSTGIASQEKLTELESKTDKNSIVSVESNNILQGAIYKDGSFHDDGSGWEYVLFLVAPNDKITFKASGYDTNVISFYALGQTPSVNTYIDGMASDGDGSSSYKEYNAIAKDFLIAAISWFRPYGTPSISIERTSLIDNLDSIIKDYEEKFSVIESELRKKQTVIKNISETGTEDNSSSLIIYDDNDNKISEVDTNRCDEEDEEQIWESEGGDKYASIGNYGIKAKAFEDLDGNKFLAHNADISNLNILIFGDSITDCTNIGLDETNIRTTSYSYHGNGYNNEQGQYVTFKMWAYMLNSILKCKDLRCYARSGATWKDSPTGGLTDGYTNLREMMSYQVRLAINDIDNPNSVFPTQGRYNPDIIICALGTNDGLNKNDTYESAMEKTMYKEDGKSIDIDATLQNLDRTKFCEAVRWSLLTLKHNFPYAILMVVLPLQRADFEQGRNTELRKMAERYGAVIIDGYSEMGIIRDTETTNNNVDLGDTTITINSGIYLKDGLHPNDKGQNLFARLIISYIKRYYVSFDGMNV